MKRCPQCLFLYPDSDERCDFDKTPLEVVDDAAVDAATSRAQPRPRPKRTLIVVAGAAMFLVVLSLAIYFGLSKPTSDAVAAPETLSTPASASPFQIATPEPSPSPVVSPSPSPSPSPKAAKEVISTAHSRATVDPVSTSGPGIASRQGGKPVIVLSSGGKIEADEVWRTKDGVWYRRNGMVTLLKRGEVKAITTR